MKIVLVNNFLTDTGGTEKYIRVMGEALSQKGHEVYYFATNRGPYAVENLQNTELFPKFSNIRNNSILKQFKSLINIFYNKEAQKNFEILLDRVKPDIVHFNCINYHLSSSLVTSCKKYNIPTVMTLHDARFGCPGGTLLKSQKEYCIAKPCFKFSTLSCILNKCKNNRFSESVIAASELLFSRIIGTYKNIDCFVCPSEAVFNLALDAGISKNKLVLINNFLDESTYHIVPNYSDKGYFLYAGRLVEEKGLKYLLQAMAKLPKEIKLLIVGAGKQENELKNIAADLNLKNVEFLGYVSGEKLHDAFENCIASVLPCNYFEAFGLSIVESFAYGKPVIASNRGAVSELIKHGENGLLFEPCNVDELIDAMMDCYNNRDKAIAMGKNAKLSSLNYSCDVFLDKLFLLYNKLLKEKQSFNKKEIEMETKTKMKIMLVNNHFCNSGGAELYTLNLGNLLKDKGHQVYYFATDKQPYFEENYEYAKYFPEYVEYLDLSKQELIKQGFTPFYNIDAQKKMAMMLDDVKPDIVHVNCISFKLTPSILKPCYERNIPVVVTTHGAQLICPSGKMIYRSEVYCENKLCVSGNPIYCILNKCFDKSLLKSTGLTAEYIFRKMHGLYDKVSYFISPSQALADLTVESGVDRNKVVCINNFVKDELFEIVPEYKVGEYFLFVGRLNKEKNVKKLLEAMILLPDEITLKIVGTGSEEDELKEFAKEKNLLNVEFLGFKTGEELQNLYKGCIATLLSCNWFENFPTSIIESFAYGKPVVGTKLGGIPEMIEDYQTGFTFELNNEVELAAKIKELYHNPDLVVKMGKNAREKAEQKYRPNVYYEKLMSIYHDIVR